MPTRTQTIPNLPAARVPPGADALAALEQRPMRPPSLAQGASCLDSATTDLGSVAPNYGQGVGPLFLSGQDAWYETGQAVILIINPSYAGPLLVRSFRLAGAGKTISLVGATEPPPSSEKEREHGVNLVGAQVTGTGGLFFAASPPSSYWRGWLGFLSADGPGCFGLQVDGDAFTELIEFTVNPGSPPPG